MSTALDLLDHFLIAEALVASSEDPATAAGRITRFKEWFRAAFSDDHTYSCPADCGHTHSAPITLKPVDATGSRIVAERGVADPEGKYAIALRDDGFGGREIVTEISELDVDPPMPADLAEALLAFSVFAADQE